MSSAFQGQVPPGIPGLDDARTPQASAPQRHALGLAAGSIRALLALGVLALLWVVVVTSYGGELKPIYIYLQYLFILILAHYFAAHGSTIKGIKDQASPLGLPRGSVRFLLVAGYVGLIAWMYLHRD